MTIKIKRKRALRKLSAMADALNACAPEDAYEAALGALGAHYYAHRLGILSRKDLDALSEMIIRIARERAASAGTSAPETPHDP